MNEINPKLVSDAIGEAIRRYQHDAGKQLYTSLGSAYFDGDGYVQFTRITLVPVTAPLNPLHWSGASMKLQPDQRMADQVLEAILAHVAHNTYLDIFSFLDAD